MKKRQPPDSVGTRDLINSSIARSRGWNRLRRLAPAASAARAVAMAAHRADDVNYVAYLTALSEMTSSSAHEQKAGIRRMAVVATDPEHREQALHALRELVRTGAAPERLTPEALGLARRTLAVLHQNTVGKPHGEGLAGGRDPDAYAARPLRVGPGGAPALTESGRVLAEAVRREPGVFTIATAAAVAYRLIPVLVVLLIPAIVDRLWLPAMRTGQVDTRMAGLLAAAFFFLFAVRAGGVFATRLGAMMLRRRLQDAQQRRVVDKYVEAPVAWHADHQPQDLIATAERSAEKVWRPLAPLPHALGSTVKIVAVLVALAHLGWWLAAIGTVTVVVLAALGNAYLRSVGPHAERARALRKEVFGLTERASTPGRDTPGADQVAIFAGVSDELCAVMIKLRRRRTAFISLFCALPVASMLLAITLAGSRPLAGGIACLVSAVVLLGLLPAPVVAIGAVIAELPTGLLGLSRIERLCDGAAGEQAEPARPELVHATAAAFSAVPACGKLDRLADSSAYLETRRTSRRGAHRTNISLTETGTA